MCLIGCTITGPEYVLHLNGLTSSLWIKNAPSEYCLVFNGQPTATRSVNGYMNLGSIKTEGTLCSRMALSTDALIKPEYHPNDLALGVDLSYIQNVRIKFDHPPLQDLNLNVQQTVLLTD